jgi:hypothetical protein
VLSAIGGCASSPKVEYFSLEPVNDHNPHFTAPASVQVIRVHVPSTLDRQQIVRQSGTYTLDISDQRRWSAPLDEMIRRVLTEDLIRMLPANSVVLPEGLASAATEKVVVDILDFAPDASGAIQLEASWSLAPADSHEPPQSRFERIKEQTNAGDTADQVAAMSRALDQLAVRMAQSLDATKAESSRSDRK